MNFLQLTPLVILETLSKLEKIDREKANSGSYATARLGAVIYQFLGGAGDWVQFLPFKEELKDSQRKISEATEQSIEFAIKNRLISPQMLSVVTLLLEEK